MANKSIPASPFHHLPRTAVTLNNSFGVNSAQCLLLAINVGQRGYGQDVGSSCLYIIAI